MATKMIPATAEYELAWTRLEGMSPAIKTRFAQATQHLDNPAIPTWIAAIYAPGEMIFPTIPAADADVGSKRRFLQNMREVERRYNGLLPIALLNGIVEAVALSPIGVQTTIVHGGVEFDRAGLTGRQFDAAAHALQMTMPLYLDAMTILSNTPSSVSGILWCHSHDCNDCGVHGTINVALATAEQRVQMAADFMSELCCMIHTMTTQNLPYAVLPSAQTSVAGGPGLPSHLSLDRSLTPAQQRWGQAY